MNDDAWKILVRRYAKGHVVCNCGHAYLTNCGHAYVIDLNGRDREVFDHPVCGSGCSAAKIAARDHVAQSVLSEFQLYK